MRHRGTPRHRGLALAYPCVARAGDDGCVARYTTARRTRIAANSGGTPGGGVRAAVRLRVDRPPPAATARQEFNTHQQRTEPCSVNLHGGRRSRMLREESISYASGPELPVALVSLS